MKRHIGCFLALLSLVLLFPACSDDVEQPDGIRMPINIIIPASDSATRTPGDPGTREDFPLPEYLYIWVVTDYGSEADPRYDVRYRKIQLQAANWTSVILSSPTYDNLDVAYQYTGAIDAILPKVRRTAVSGKAYVAVSKYDIDPANAYYTVPSTLSGVEALTFDVPAPTTGITRSDVIRDIYSSPANLTLDYPSSEGDYYGTISDFASNQPRIDMVLYHVGAKLDLNWNVAEADQPTLWLTAAEDGITVNALKQEGCFLFRPMMNTAVGSDPYTATIVTNTGNQWYGREYLYTIPYFNGSNEYPITATVLKTVNGTGQTKTTALDVPLGAAPSTYVFTPWMVGFVTVDNTY